MTDIRPNAQLPKGDKNGLIPVADLLVKEPLRLHAALIVFDLSRGIEDYDLAALAVTVRVRRIELLLPQDLDAAQAMLRRALEERSGMTVLDLDVETEIDDIFRTMKDPDSADDPDEPGDGKGGKQ